MNDKSQHCAVCSGTPLSVFDDDDQTFKEVIIDERDFTEEFCELFGTKSIFSRCLPSLYFDCGPKNGDK